MSRFKPSTIAIALALVAAMAFAAGCKDRTPRSVRGKGADFTLLDLSGKAVSLQDFRGKVVMLEFWATWCPPCRAAIPELIALHERMRGRDFALVTVSMDDRKSKVEDFVKEYGITYTVLMDDAGVSDQYGVFSIPTTFLIGRDGTVVSKHAGYGEGMIDGLIEDIEELMAEPVAPEAPAPAEGQPTEGGPQQEGQPAPQEPARQ